MIMHSCVPRTLCTWWSSVASYAKNISLSLSVVADTSVISFLCILWCCDSFNVSVDETNIVLVPTIMCCTVCTVVYSPGSQDQEEDNQPQHWLHSVLHWHTNSGVWYYRVNTVQLNISNHTQPSLPPSSVITVKIPADSSSQQESLLAL